MDKRSARLGELEAPETTNPAVYFFSLVGLLALAAAFCIQLLLTALLAVEPPDRNVDELSGWGEFLFFPEWDILFYLVAILAGLTLGMALVWLWNRRLRDAGGFVSESLLVRQTLVQVLVALAGTGLFLHQFIQARAIPPELPTSGFSTSNYVVIAAIALVTLATALGARTGGKGSRSFTAFDYLDSQDPTGRTGRLWSIWDLVTPVAIGAAIYVPAWRQIAGRVFMEETLMHWDYFAMGPALSYSHGFALGSEVHSAYGLGWPIFFSAISDWVPLSYGRMIQIGSIYAVIYLVGVYLLLRLVVKRPAIAVLGTVLATLPFFVGTEGLTIWRIPNVNVLRWPFDVWCFIALVMYGKSPSRGWAATAGGIVGLAVFFVIDTGMELAAAVAFFWLCVVALGPDRGRRLKDLLISAASALVVLIAGLLIAGRGAIFSIGFVTGWLEAPLEFGGGFGMLPVATFPPSVTIVGLSGIFILCLTQIGYTLTRVLHHRARFFELFAGCIALYALLVLVRFMGHSAGLVFPRLLIPSFLLLTILLDRAAGHTGSYVKHAWGASVRTRLALALPWVALTAVLVFLVARPNSTVIDGFLAYPNLVSTQIVDSTPEGVCLMTEPKDLCGLPEPMSETAEVFQSIVARLEDLQRDGNTFGVIDETGSLFYLATDTAPYGRYSRAFTATHTKQLLEQLTQALEQDPPDYILTRLPIVLDTAEFAAWSSFGYGPSYRSPYLDTWEALLDVVHRRYELQTEIRPFQIWRLTDPD